MHLDPRQSQWQKAGKDPSSAPPQARPEKASRMAQSSAGWPQTLADSFSRRMRGGPENTAFWLVSMSADRAAGRIYLDAQARKEAQKLEKNWIEAWVHRWPAQVEIPHPTKPLGQRQMQWQQCVDDLCEAAGFMLPPPSLVWQPAMQVHRGQYLFQAEGSLLQLRPDAAGSPFEWLATVAHETFHHAQHMLLVCLYRGYPELPPPYGALAAYYRDARNVYRVPGAECPPEQHRKQWMEVGAWRFGQAIVQRHQAHAST